MTPDAPPDAAPSAAAPPADARGRNWGWFCAWALVGALYCLALLAAMTIGIFIVPFAVVLTVVLSHRPGSRAGLGGLVSGAALPVAYVAFLNRNGPGTICRTFENASGGGESCTQEWSPWPFVAAALALAIAGVIVFARAEGRAHSRT